MEQQQQQQQSIFFGGCFLQEFGQSTPEIRRSARKIPTIFKKRKMEKENSSNNCNTKPQRYVSPSSEERVNGTSNNEDSEDDVAGEYLEVKTKRGLLLLGVV